MKTRHSLTGTQLKYAKSSDSESNSSRAPDLTAKVVLIGDVSVGKTTILQRLRNIKSPSQDRSEGTASDTPPEACRPCAGRRLLEYVEKTIEDDQGKRVLLKVHDTLGQERYRSLTASFYRDSTACILFFDTSNEESFSNIPYWLDEVKTYCGFEDVIMVIVGTQTTSHERAVPRERAEKLALECGALCMEVNKESDVNVDILFRTVASMVAEKYSKLGSLHSHHRVSSQGSFSLTGEKVTKKFSCCAC